MPIEETHSYQKLMLVHLKFNGTETLNLMLQNSFGRKKKTNYSEKYFSRAFYEEQEANC